MLLLLLLFLFFFRLLSVLSVVCLCFHILATTVVAAFINNLGVFVDITVFIVSVVVFFLLLMYLLRTLYPLTVIVTNVGNCSYSCRYNSLGYFLSFFFNQIYFLFFFSQKVFNLNFACYIYYYLKHVPRNNEKNILSVYTPKYEREI